MMALILDILSWIMLLSGSVFVLLGGIGALRLPNFYTRMHAASLTDSAGALLILGGMTLQSGLSLVTIKLLVILAFLLLTGPTATYALANAALMSGMEPDAENIDAEDAQ